MKFQIPLIIFVISTLTACTQSIDARYIPGVSLKNNGIEGQKLAIHEFNDKRAPIGSGDAKSKGFVSKQGVWKMGLTYQGIPYQSASIILQDVFIKEFKRVGVDAFKARNDSSSSYSLKGDILSFGFNNDAGLWTVTSNQQVALSLTLSDANGNLVVEKESFSKFDTANEGMAVMHSTNVNKLMNQTLRAVVVDVINRTNEKLSSLGFETISVTINGTPVDWPLKTYAGFSETQPAGSGQHSVFEGI